MNHITFVNKLQHVICELFVTDLEVWKKGVTGEYKWAVPIIAVRLSL